MTEVVFLFGHRQQHGKNTVVTLFEKYLKERGLEYISTYFAKKLKKTCADKFGLDFSKMEDNEYKMSCPEWLEKKTIYWDTINKSEVPHWVFMDPGQLKIEVITKPRTVRDVLIEEGVTSRGIWKDIWTHGVYEEIHQANKQIGIVSDYRYPNEYDYVFSPAGKSFAPKKVVKVLVHRPNGIFKNDGADNLLPDNDGKFWDHVIINENCESWEVELTNKVTEMAKKYGI